MQYTMYKRVMRIEIWILVSSKFLVKNNIKKSKKKIQLPYWNANVLFFCYLSTEKMYLKAVQLCIPGLFFVREVQQEHSIITV